jgi:5,10-methylenetetrahydromethanopterin reductase
MDDQLHPQEGLVLTLRIGATVSFARNPSTTVAKLEELGIDSLWMYEIFQGYEAFARAGFIAAKTRRARIGVGVVNSYSRHPAVIAMGASLLTNMTGGRAALVAGIGGDAWVGTMLGYDQSRPTERFREFLTILRDLFRGQEVNHQSSNFVLNKVKLFPAPEHQVPIIVACEQPKMMKLAGELADGVYLEPTCCPLGYIRWAADTIHPSRERNDGFRVIANLPLRITMDLEVARNEIKPMLAFHLSFPGEGELYLEKAGFSPSLSEEIGEASGVRLRIREKRSMTGIFGSEDLKRAAEMVPDKFVDQCAVLGDIDTCKRRLSDLERAGLTDVVFSFQDDRTEDLAIISS